jgi:hypothetical protein
MNISVTTVDPEGPRSWYAADVERPLDREERLKWFDLNGAAANYEVPGTIIEAVRGRRTPSSSLTENV